MVAMTRSKGKNLTLLFKASKAGITKRSKSTSTINALSSRLAHDDGSTTPTPAVAKAMATPSSSQTPNVAVPIVRPTSPTATNALLVSPPLAPISVSPHASSAASSSSSSSSSSPFTRSTTTTTTSDILKTGIDHLLSIEPKLTPLITSHPCALFSPAGLAEPVDPFYSLMCGIISQQISSAAARTVKLKFISLFQPALGNAGLTFPTPAMVLGYPQELLRTGGLSARKAEYAHSLAEKFVSGDLSAEILSSASDEEVVQRLVAVRGIGVWSAEMFLIFGLKRMDVFSLGDLGIQRGQAVIAGRDVGKLKSGGKGKWKYMSEEDMIKHSEPFRPYRSLYMWYLWKASDVSVESLRNTTSSSSGAVAAKKKKKAPAKKVPGPE